MIGSWKVESKRRSSCAVLGVLFALLMIGLAGCKKQPEKKTNQKGGRDRDLTVDRNQTTTQPNEDVKYNQGKEGSGGKDATDFSFRWRKSSGIDFVHTSGIDDQRAFPAANGSGIGVIDFDRDGWEDLYFANGKPFPVDSPNPNSSNQFYRNLGEWKFRNQTEQAGLDLDAYATGIAIGDFDNDGFQDVYVGCYGANVLFQNMGDGRFEVLRNAGTHGLPHASTVVESGLPSTPGWAASSAFVDFNNDGNLDIYVGNYGIWNLELKNNCGDRENGKPRFCSPTSVRPQADVLYENQGDGTFVDVSEAAGIYPTGKDKNGKKVFKSYRTQGVIVSDFNLDGLPDIYCGNDMNSNLLLINQGGGKFSDRTELSSTGYGVNGEELASMGVAAGDVNNDGIIDLFCTNFSNELNSFYLGLGDLQYAEVSKRNRLGEGAMPWVGWGTEFVDWDQDGWMDVIVTNGHVDPNIQDFESGQQHHQPCLIWKNEKGRFRLASVAGEYFLKRHPGRALAIADYDRDGDLDLVIGHQDQPPALLENICQTADTSAVESELGAKPSIKNRLIQLIGTRANRDGIGCRIEFQWNKILLQRVVNGGGSYLSTHSSIIGETRWSGVSPAQVIWPGGENDMLAPVGSDDSRLTLIEGESAR